jgi:hypothetical protein
MSGNIWKIGLATAVLLHGLGHFLFAVPLWGVGAEWGQSTQSWLLGGGAAAQIVGGTLFTAVIIGFAAAAYGMFASTTWWSTLLFDTAVVSLASLVLFFATPIPSGVVPASLFDISILAALQLTKLPPELVNHH